jgi:5-formyltetrahydrofolate cyclo-ligase
MYLTSGLCGAAQPCFAGGLARMAPFRTEKSEIRDAARARRAAAAETDPAAGAELADTLLADVPVSADAVVAGYFPIGDEIDVRPVLDRLRAAGHRVTLPRVVGADLPLSFAAWSGSDAELTDGPYGTRQPAGDLEEVLPGILILPLLAFDRHGVRLGYGGGYYDRTLARLRDAGPVVAIGAAYSAQEVTALPNDEHDQRLDWVVTEREAIRIGKET